MSRRKTTASAVGDATPTSSSPETPPRAEQASGITPASRTYTDDEKQALHLDICRQIERGASTVTACDNAGVDRGVWYRWMRDGALDEVTYTRARELGASWHAEGIVETAERLGLTDPAYGRLVVDAKKWVAARLYGRQWGDKVDVTSDGKSIGPIAALPASVLITGGDHGEV